MEKETKIKWRIAALSSLDRLLTVIEGKSIQQAERIVDAIIDKIESLRKYPERFPLDKLKSDNDGTFRAFEVKKLRISYRHARSHIQIRRVRHVRQFPHLH